MEHLESAKIIVQIAFWAVAATIAILTYRVARRTVLQPIRTEVFKAQLKAMWEVMELFLGKDELELRAEFDFETLFHANVWHLVNDYASNFFDFQLKVERQPYNLHDCPIRIYAHASIEPSTAHTLTPKVTSDTLPDDPRVRAERWDRYQTDYVLINRKCREAERHLTKLLSNPLLPQALVELLTEYRSLAGQNQLILFKLLDDAAKEMPEKYATLEELERMPPNCLHKLYMKDFNHLKSVADQIVEFNRNYFDADDLTKSKKVTG